MDTSDARSNMEKAIAAVNELYSKGWDYCDAVEAMAKDYQVDENELDEKCINS